MSTRALMGTGVPDYITDGNGNVVWRADLGCPCHEGLGDAAKTTALVSTGASAASKAIASGSAVASKVLTTVGISAQAVPVVGTVLGGVALVAGAIAKLISARSEARAINKQAKGFEQAITLLRQKNTEADMAITQGNAVLESVKKQIQDTGLDGLDGWFKNTFFPRKAAKENLNDAVKKYNATYPELEAALNEKLTVLETMQAQFTALQSKLTTNKNVLKYGGIALAVIVAAVVGKKLISNSRKTAKS
jgi:DNA-binding protein H-NS